MGGTLIVLGEDYGEGGVVAQERSHAFAIKSLMWLLDPRPNLATIVDMVEHGFELSETSNTPVMMELRIRACHVHGSLSPAKTIVAPAVSTRHQLDGPPKEFIYDRLAHPPAIFRQEKLKSDVRLPAARKLHRRAQAERDVRRAASDVGIVVQGGLYNGLMRALRTARPRRRLRRQPDPDPRAERGLSAGAGGDRRLLAGTRKRILVLEEGQPEFIEQEIATFLRRADCSREAARQGLAAHGGRVQRSRRMVRGLTKFLAPARAAPGHGSRCRVVGIRPERSKDKAAASARRAAGSARRPSASAARSGRCSRR